MPLLPASRRGARRRQAPALALVVCALLAIPAAANELEDELGRSEVRVYAAPFPLQAGLTVAGAELPERLERLGYRRVRARPNAPGEYFYGFDNFWIFRRAHRHRGRRYDAELIGLRLRRADGRVLEVTRHPDRSPRAPWLEPELLAESLTERRARRILVGLDELPEIAWRSVLAIEDARFFDHGGVDPRSVARALLKNVLAGKVTQGGSTITQQLVKIRDLTPKRTVGRKLSEAARALALEAEYDKREILEAYLNAVYFGHLDGVAVYGYGAASRAYFSKPASALALGEAALLAGMIQGPNRLHPARNPESALARQRQVLDRLAELGWASKEAAARAARALPPLALDWPPPAPAPHFRAWTAEIVDARAGGRRDRGRGVVVETSLDLGLQEAAEAAVAAGLGRLRRSRRGLASRRLGGALVALDAETGAVVAYVGGDPAAAGDAIDRVRKARRQPGSAVKPLVALEALEACGGREPLHPSRRIADAPLVLELPGGPWRPQNPDGRFRGEVDLRRALVESLNVPFVRVGRWCGFEATADRFGRAGLEVPEDPPPAFVLGAVETTPLELAAAFAAIEAGGRRPRPLPVRRIERPGGRRIGGWLGRAAGGGRSVRVAGADSAWLVRDLLLDAVARGTGRTAALEGLEAWGKTGTSSERRDAWFVGAAAGLVAAVWVGLDEGGPLGLDGSAAAAPIWKAFMARAAAARPAGSPAAPRGIVARWIDEESGLRLRGPRRGARRELYRRGHEPPRKRLFGANRPEPTVR